MRMKGGRVMSISKKEFPKTIYVNWEGEKDERFLLANERMENIESDKKVGIYELKEIKTKKVTFIEELI
jgi:hypothetical protein